MYSGHCIELANMSICTGLSMTEIFQNRQNAPTRDRYTTPKGQFSWLQAHLKIDENPCEQKINKPKTDDSAA